MIDIEKVIDSLEGDAQSCGEEYVMIPTGTYYDALALLKEQSETELCDRCGRVRLKSKWEGR